MGQMVVANLSTSNILERTRPKGLMAGYVRKQKPEEVNQ
jgi:hypothetical protein